MKTGTSWTYILIKKGGVRSRPNIYILYMYRAVQVNPESFR